MSTSDQTPEPLQRGRRGILSWSAVPLIWIRNYWFRVVIFAFLGIYLGEKVDDTDYWIRTRYDVYQFLQNLPHRKAHPQRTALVLIGDEEFWKGELQGRRPVKRDYIARIV